MELNKIRNMSDEELVGQEKSSAEQLFRLRFQTAMGQNDGVKKLRELRKDIARIKTVARERKLGIQIAVKQEAAPVAKKKSPAKKKAAKAVKETL
jgi:large subunit ribosomal protein L29